MSVHDQLEEFCTLLRHRKVEGSLATGRRTAELLRIFVSSCRHSDAVALVEDVRSVGNKLQAAKPIGASPKLICHIALIHLATKLYLLVFVWVQS